MRISVARPLLYGEEHVGRGAALELLARLDEIGQSIIAHTNRTLASGEKGEPCEVTIQPFFVLHLLCSSVRPRGPKLELTKTNQRPVQLNRPQFLDSVGRA